MGPARNCRASKTGAVRDRRACRSCVPDSPPANAPSDFPRASVPRMTTDQDSNFCMATLLLFYCQNAQFRIQVAHIGNFLNV